MSTRRASKRVAQSKSSTSTNGTKKPKVSTTTTDSENEIDGYQVIFEWEGDSSKWVRYSRKYIKILAGAFNDGKDSVDLTLSSGFKMAVLLDRMVQKNVKTGWERNVRVGVKGPFDTDFFTYQWLDESGKWCSYCINTCIEIAKSAAAGNLAVETTTTPVPYEIDLKKMSQTNTKTKFSRKFRKEVADGEDPLEDEEEDDVDDKTDVQVKKETNGSVSSAKAKSGKTTKKSAPVKTEVKEEQESDEEEAKPKSGSKKGKSSGQAAKSSVRTVVVKKGSAPVDSLCPVANKTSVYESGNIIWDCMLNQTNIAQNNNKYFLLQLLKENDKNAFYVWFRWGRVGYNGQNSLSPCGGSLDAAKDKFQKKFQDKTKNDWATKDNFEKVPGKYDLVKMDYDADKGTDDVDAPEKKDDAKVPDSKLDKKLQNLINLICNVKSMEEAMVEMKYDAKKLPLGKLTKDQIKAGYTALATIESLVNSKASGSLLAEACSAFYTRIPHEFGMQTPPLIRTPQDVKAKLQLLEALEDIEIAIKMLKGGDKSENPVDRHYHQLHCQLSALDHNDENFKLVNKYLQQTHATTHGLYRMELLDVYECVKEGEQEGFTDLGNRMLLWHGSRLTNWAGILGNGLRIAPPEAPVTGYMFGKGVYFADMSSKSANYCFATKTKNVGLMLLCDVALGTTEDKLQADPSAAKLPKGKHSVRGLGKVAPDGKDSVTTSSGAVMPLGRGIDTGVVNPKGYTLNYNEFIVYDTKQILMKYLVQVKFHFK